MASNARARPAIAAASAAPRRPRVALLVETSVVYGREIHEGIAAYVRAHRPWSMFVAQRELGAPPPRWLVGRGWDGIISRPTTPALARRLRRAGIPTVDLNDLHAGLGLPRIRSDNEAIGGLAAGHLLERGFRHVAFCGFAGEPWAAERRDGFARAARAAGLTPPAVYESRWRGPGAPAWDRDQDQLARWLGRLPLPVGVAACNDLRGQHVLEACRRADLAVPERVAVIGVDNDELLCRLCDPPLSTVVPDARRVGYEAAALLDRLMAEVPSTRSPSPSSRRSPASVAATATDVRIPPTGVVARQSTDSLAVDDADVAAALRFIRERACDGIRVADVLREVPVSRSLLERRFQRAIGRSPHAEIRAVQVRRAAQLLAETDVPLARIAELSGFAHMEYLSYYFKRAVGESPRAYRRSRVRRPEDAIDPRPHSPDGATP